MEISEAIYSGLSHSCIIPENMKDTQEQEWQLPWSALLTRAGFPCNLQFFMLLDIKCSPSEWAKWTPAVQMDLIFVLMLESDSWGKVPVWSYFHKKLSFPENLFCFVFLVWVCELYSWPSFPFMCNVFWVKSSEYRKLISNYSATNVVEFFSAFTFPLCFCCVCSVVIVQQACLST